MNIVMEMRSVRFEASASILLSIQVSSDVTLPSLIIIIIKVL